MKKKWNFIKKYNKKLKILKFILLVIIILFIVRVGRNAIILKQIENKSQNNIYSNYHVKCWKYERDMLSIVDAYYKEDGRYLIRTSNYAYSAEQEDYINEKIEYFDGIKSNYYITNNDEKIAHIAIDSVTIEPVFELKNYHINSNNFITFILNSIFVDIKSEKCNEIDCYAISNFENSYSLYGFFHKNTKRASDVIYVNKENGLTVRAPGYSITILDQTIDGIVDLYYEFNSVYEVNLQEPDASEYTIAQGENDIKNHDEYIKNKNVEN